MSLLVDLRFDLNICSMTSPPYGLQSVVILCLKTIGMTCSFYKYVLNYFFIVYNTQVILLARLLSGSGLHSEDNSKLALF